ncbi:MAG: ACP S-malonyltransferase [Hormoscilla sp. GUM202]|nr:ACP S-malonyltransferase [Hormoscilla sp. GM7CHS1pb]MBO1351858.1 ACP S-malonyltransferase [Hormoscilla sp. GUM202]
MIFLIDHNIDGQAFMLSQTIANEGWLDWAPVIFITFAEMKLPIESNDRVVWRFAQSNQMILLTANRSMEGEDSLEQVLREENTPTSLPVVTIGNADRIMKESNYRKRCVERLMEIVLDIENYKGVTRLFIP